MSGSAVNILLTIAFIAVVIVIIAFAFAVL
jgi:hypothetical protein